MNGMIEGLSRPPGNCIGEVAANPIKPWGEGSRGGTNNCPEGVGRLPTGEGSVGVRVMTCTGCCKNQNIKFKIFGKKILIIMFNKKKLKSKFIQLYLK